MSAVRRIRRRRNRMLLRGGLAASLAASSACGTDDASDAAGQAGTEMPAAGTSGGSTTGGAGGAGGGTFANPPPLSPSPTMSPTPVATRPLPGGVLGEQAVLNEAPAQRVLYSWTTDEQYQELRANPVLLTRSEHPELGSGLVQQMLSDLAAAGDPLSQALTGPAFQKVRYAWPNPWATLRGWPGESYGNKLIRVVLRDDAWLVILGLVQGQAQWQVVDLDGNAVPRKDAIMHPSRIGAIFHMHEADDGLACGGSFVGGGAGAFREYVLPNERMIAEWSLATEEMRQRLEDDIAALEAYRDEVMTGGGFGSEGGFGSAFRPFETAVACVWQGNLHVVDTATSDEGYALALALTSSLYAPTVENLQALIDELKLALFDPDPFVHSP